MTPTGHPKADQPAQQLQYDAATLLLPPLLPYFAGPDQAARKRAQCCLSLQRKQSPAALQLWQQSPKPALAAAAAVAAALLLAGGRAAVAACCSRKTAAAGPVQHPTGRRQPWQRQQGRSGSRRRHSRRRCTAGHCRSAAQLRLVFIAMATVVMHPCAGHAIRLFVGKPWGMQLGC